MQDFSAIKCERIRLAKQNSSGINVRSEVDRLLKKAANKASGERSPEDFGEPRTKWDAFFSSWRGKA
jgi:hypothetical protein